MENIVLLTDRAIKNIEQILNEMPDSKGKCVRLSVIGGGCSGLSYKMDFDFEKEKDRLIPYDNFKVIIDPKSSIYLKGVTLDYSEGLMDRGFKFINPNAKNTCGCGESFSV